METRNQGKMFNYLAETFAVEPQGLETARIAGEERHAGMQLSPYEGSLVAWLVKMSGATSILEMGTFMGYSALWMASTGANVTTLEFSASNAVLARQHIENSPYAHKITLHETEILEWLSSQKAQPLYDFVFIDAEKKSYMAYLEAVLPLLKPNAWIVADNTLLWGAVSGEPTRSVSGEAVDVMKAFNKRLAGWEEFEGMMLPTLEGLTVARRRV